jgi:starch synthase (maltosyl-transferring)
MTTTRPSLKRGAQTAVATATQLPDEPGAGELGTRRSIVIERVQPELDGGRHPVKRVVGDELLVTADIFAHGHDLLDAVLLLRPETDLEWTEVPMRLIDNDRWSGSIALLRNARHRYTIEAWRDAIGSWRAELERKVEAGLAVGVELDEGRALVEAALGRAGDADADLLREALARDRRSRSQRARLAALAADEVIAAARRHPDRIGATRLESELPLTVDCELARTGAWYEMFPRSQGRDPKHPTPTTLIDAEWRLPDIAAMGFDVVYLPPIHPIGRTNRKGRDNALLAAGDDPGSPWAIGSEAGGHDAVAPELGGLPAFDHFRGAVEEHGMQLALDLALQASPDHPWVREHPEWFRHAPDGSIKYAENPPKKYQDILPFDFDQPDRRVRVALWEAWLAIAVTWIERGVKVFRVDNPHTKPVPFWEWLIREVQTNHPDVVFLSEAFTRPKMMRALAKVGFSQSYTYFTWRESAGELREYLTELTQSEMREYFRGNLFTNTPDINPHHLDHGRPAFQVWAVLAATLSPAWGIYSGFELCEKDRLDEREEYDHSEKYEIRARDWEARPNVKRLISGLNRVRHESAALQRNDTLSFEEVSGERTLFYRKALPAGDVDPLTGGSNRVRDPVYVAVNCDFAHPERAILHPNLPAIGIGWDEPYRMVDLITGRWRRLRGADIPVELDPTRLPYRVFTIQPLDD